MQPANNLQTDFPTIKNFFNSAQLIEGPPTHWRLRAKLAVRGSVQQPLIGLFKEGSHEVIDLQSCPDHHPNIDAALALVRREMIKQTITPYNEKTLRGQLRYIQCVVERQTGLIQLTLVANAPNQLQNFAKHLSQLHNWHSIWINVQEGSTNTIFGKQWIHIYGKEELWETIANREICFHPGCFSQANLTLFETIIEDLLHHLLPNKKVIELYAGVGMIGLIALQKSESVTLIESNPLCAACFKKSAVHLKNIHFHAGDAKKLAHLIEGHEVLIVDPPRKGIDADLMQSILSTKSLEQLIYISCGAESFVRDAKKLLDANWKIAFLRCYHLFPGTPHIETLAVLIKEQKFA